MTQDVLAIASTVIAVLSLGASLVLWYRSVVRKSYAAERDFRHLKRSYESLSQNVSFSTKLVDEKLDGVMAEIIRLQGQLEGSLDRKGRD